MKGGANQSHGFTIIEVLVVLAVTGAILASAIVLVAGRQSQTEFTLAVQDVQSQIQQTVQDITSGYYPNSGNFKCSGGLGNISFSSGSQSQGTNSGCLFLGKVIQFAAQNITPQPYITYTIAGSQTDSSGNQIQTYTSASPTVVDFNGNISAYSATSVLENGLSVYKMCYNSSNCNAGTPSTATAYAVGFLDSLANYSSSTTLSSGSQNLNLVAIPEVVQYDNSAEGKINTKLGSDADSASTTSVEICLASSATNQSALLTMSIGNGQIAANSQVIPGDKTC